MDYYSIYNLRRYNNGINRQEQIKTKREKSFEHYYKKSAYKIDFDIESKKYHGVFEEYKQNETKTLGYLLTSLDLNIPGGTIITIDNNPLNTRVWMVYYLELKQMSGYNRYILLRMTHLLKWTDKDGIDRSSWAYMYGPGDSAIRDDLRSRSRNNVLYTEDLNLNFFILPKNQYLNKDDYFIIGEDPYKEFYRVTGYDRQSTDGVEYVSIDPIYEFDLTPPPVKSDKDDEEDFFWLNGGDE